MPSRRRSTSHAHRAKPAKLTTRHEAPLPSARGTAVRRPLKPRHMPINGDMARVRVRAWFQYEDPSSEQQALTLYVFDDEGHAMCHCQTRGHSGQLELPQSLLGQTVTVGIAPAEPGRKPPTLAQMLDRGLTVVRVPWDDPRKGLWLGHIVIPKQWFKRSCCRVRGRVIRQVRLPNGQVVTRPLCNARIVICEVDISPRLIIKQLPNDLIRQIEIDAADLLSPRLPQPPPAPPSAVSHIPVIEHEQHRHTGHVDHGLTAGIALRTAAAAHHIIDDVTDIRSHLLAHIGILHKHWCRFAQLYQRYDVDCLTIAPVDEDGRFDTDISYPCYGDRPDLYFKVEQECNGVWRTVHAPSIACNTRWDYCCGDHVEIVVTNDNAGLGPALTMCGPFAAPDPAAVGQWQLLPYTSQVFVVHTALMRTGQVLLFSGGVENQLPRESRVWDPFTGGFTGQVFADDLFCAFQVILPDGRVLVMGGSHYNGPHGQGVALSYTFDPAALTWTKHADMAFARWYPTAVTLDDGRVLVASGRAAGPVVAQMERFNPSTNSWTTLPGSANKVLDIYPSLHLMAGGKVFYTGTRWEGGSSSPRPWPAPPLTALFNPLTNTWSDVGAHVVPNRTEGMSILLPPRNSSAHHHGHGEAMPPPGTLSRVLVFGGDCGSPAERVSAEVIDLVDHEPVWQRIADMHHRRVNPNAVLLADGTVLVCAGITGFKWDPDPGRVLESEIFDPQTLTWKRGAVMTEGRQYHSISLLLPDGRVLNAGSVGGSGGGTNLLSMEVYSPPYLFRGPRPRITAWQNSVRRGDHLVVTSPDACRIRRVALVRPGAPTHHTDSEQRYLPVEFSRDGSCNLHIHIPDGLGLLPPGYYMLFILDDCDIPSIARFVEVH